MAIKLLWTANRANWHKLPSTTYKSVLHSISKRWLISTNVPMPKYICVDLNSIIVKIYSRFLGTADKFRTCAAGFNTQEGTITQLSPVGSRYGSWEVGSRLKNKVELRQGAAGLASYIKEDARTFPNLNNELFGWVQNSLEVNDIFRMRMYRPTHRYQICPSEKKYI